VRPEREESPVGGVDCWQEDPETVDLGDVASDDGEKVGRQGNGTAKLERIVK
jgi:hypothetical protein